MADEPKTEAQPDLAARVAELEAKLAKEAQQNEMLQRTLSALGGGNQPQAQQHQPQQALMGNPFAGLPPEAIGRIKAQLGWDDATLAQYLPVFSAIMGEFAAPIVQNVYGALGGAADYIDRHDVMLTDKELYEKYKDEVEQERSARMNRGERSTRKELVQIVRARHLPELVAAEAEKRATEQRERAASADSATTEGTVHVGQAKPSPSPTSAAKKPKSREEIEAIPDREERIKAIEEATEGQTF